MDHLINGFGGINTFYIKDNEGNLINYGNGVGVMQSIKIERVDDKMDKKREEMLVELQEKLEIMDSTVSDLQYLVDEELHDGEKDENMDLKTIIKLNRINDELETCYDLIVEESL